MSGLAVIRAAFVAAGCAFAAAPVSSNDTANDKKASVTVKASPAISFSPARVVATADIKGGPNDAESLYCATVEWVWGDDTRSESKADCDPYEPGRSEIKRRYTLDHTYQTAGRYRIQFFLKQKDKRVLGGSTSVTVRPGVRDIGLSPE